MELLCPNCQKKLTVPEQYAGQLMRCPLCQGTFTVPALHSAVAAAESVEPFGSFSPPPTAKTEPYSLASEPANSPPLPPMSAEVGSAAEEVAPPTRPSVAAAPILSAPPPSAGYSHSRTFSINPNVVPWLAPGGLVAVFLLMFFPWVSFGISLGHTELELASISAWGLGFGKGGSALFIFYNLLTVLAMVLAVASLLMTVKIIPAVPALKPIEPWRELIVGGIAGLALCFVTLYYVIALFRSGFVPINFWGVLAWWIHAIVVAGAFLEFWLQRRGPSKPLPRVSIEW